MKNRFWRFVIQPHNVFYISTIAVGIIVGILSIFQDIRFNITIGVVLLALSSTTSLLLSNSQKMGEMKEFCSSKQSIGNIFYNLEDLEDEIRTNINAAEEIWLLTRTGQGWMKSDRFKNELDKVFKNKCKLLVLDPENGALKMVKMSIKMDWQKSKINSYLDKKCVSDFLDWFKMCYPETDIRVIDYLPAYTLLIINPSKRDFRKSLIYVELSCFDAGSTNRLIFKISLADSAYFDRFINEFNTMWKKSRQW